MAKRNPIALLFFSLLDLGDIRPAPQWLLLIYLRDLIDPVLTFINIKWCIWGAANVLCGARKKYYLLLLIHKEKYFTVKAKFWYKIILHYKQQRHSFHKAALFITGTLFFIRRQSSQCAIKWWRWYYVYTIHTY